LWPFGAALRGEASNHLMLRWPKTVVVNDEEKAPARCQVGIGKVSVSESLLTCRNLETTSKPGCQCDPGMSLAGARLLARRVCHERGRELEVGQVPERGAAWKMKDVGPSEPSCGGRLQTTFCCIS